MIRKQWFQIRVGGLPVLHHKLRKALLFMLNGIWAIPALVIIRAFRPWLHVRMGVISYNRIGHFVGDAALYLAHRSLRLKNVRTIDLFWLPRPTCNEQWARMVRRQLFVRWWVRYLIFFNRLIPGGANHNLISTHGTRDIHGILQKSSARFEFTLDEEATAKAWLRRRGWQDGEPFICLLVRDSAYLSNHPDQVIKNNDWSYHNYRDTDIDTYVESVQALVDKGYWVIRMGKIMRKRLPFNHPRVIDYPFVDDQDDLLDIWLSSHCAFFVSTGSGIDMIPSVYHVPIVFINFNPLTLFRSYSYNIHVPKHLRWKNSRQLFKLRDHLRHNYYRAEDYVREGIVIVDNSSSEITSVVLEMEQRLAGIWKDGIEDQARQKRFWEVFRAWPDFHKFHSYIYPEARVGCAWLKSMGDAFLE